MDKVSIITPTYKRSDYLKNAIDSVLNQTYKNIEIIVVDDNGNESPYRETTAKLMEAYKDDERVRYLPLEKNVGAAMARNAGIEVAEGEFITFLDDDDEYLPKKIEVQLKAMQENGWDASVMDGATYNENGDLLSIKTQQIRNGMSQKELIVVHMIHQITGTNSFMFKKEAIRKIGGFMKIVACEEFMLMMTALENGFSIGCISQTLIKNYIREGERLSTGEKKYVSEKIMYSYKKKYFSYLTYSERRKVASRHFGVLGYVQLKRKKYLPSLFYFGLSALNSPTHAYGIYKNYKGKLMQ